MHEPVLPSAGEPQDGAVATHPLDPLTAAEIEQVRAILGRDGRTGPATRFPLVALEEPPKAVVRAFDGGQRAERHERQARVVCFDLGTKAVHEAVVSITAGTVVEFEARDGVGPGLLDEERERFEPVIRADERWRDAMLRRGVVDIERVRFECVAMENPRGLGAGVDRRRRARCVGFLCEHPQDNYYAHPIDGVVVLVDVARNAVIDVQETPEPLPVPAEPGNFDAEGVRRRSTCDRPGLRPLDIVQPGGVSFSLQGSLLTWQRWRLRIGFHPVEGLVLHRVAYADRGRLRPILYRAALSEMVVPYGDTTISQFWRAVFDAGEVGLGLHANSLALGCDCLGEIRYLDAVVADVHGRPRTISNAICVHEEDAGIAWKHDGVHVATSEVRRSRRLVVSFFATIGNYDYGFYWYFYTDGSVEAEVKLTGIVYTGAVADGQEPAHGGLLAPNLYGPHHQHLFNFRLDFEVDGEANTVYEVDAEPVAMGASNPNGNAFVVRARALETEAVAQRLVDVQRARYWSVVNERSLNRLGQPVAYKLVPQPSAALICDERSYVADVGGFARKHLWVTPFDPRERYAAGDFPAFGDRGLAHWVLADRPVRDRDVVVWHTVGTTHAVRPEDWPVMPVERVGFALKPVGFFDHNPALDLEPPSPVHPCSVGGDCHA
jgi:primary-amine oxidase